MKIIIFAPTSTKLWHKCYNERPLGGADTAILKLIEYLGETNQVKAYINVKEKSTKIQTEGGIIEYIPAMDCINTTDECDLLIIYRKVWMMPRNITAKKKIFYSQDTADTPCFEGLRQTGKQKGASEYFNSFDKIVVLSKFHKSNLQDAFNINDEKFAIIGNAADFQGELPAKLSHRFIYASTPFRGLVVLARMWKHIKQKFPDAELHIFSSMTIYDGEFHDKMVFGALYEKLKSMDGIVYHGSKLRHEVIAEMKKCDLLLYPNTFPETYCSLAMEARSCSTPIITSNMGALPETCGGAGIFIEGNPYSEEYQVNFLKSLFKLYESPARMRKLIRQCYPIRDWHNFNNEWKKVI